MLEVARGLGVPDARLLLLPNWANLDLVRPLDRPSSFRASLGIPDGRRVVLYTGNLGRKQGVRPHRGGGRALHRPGRRGAAALRRRRRGRRRRRTDGCRGRRGPGPDRLLRLPLQPDAAFNELLNLADVHLIVQDPGVSDRVMPSKLTNMLASGRPVVATSYGGTALSALIVRRMWVKSCRRGRRSVGRRSGATACGRRGQGAQGDQRQAVRGSPPGSRRHSHWRSCRPQI